MAGIYFYDTTELDRKQLDVALEGSQHHIQYIADKIEPSNCNAEAEIISVFTTSSVTREVIESMPNLKLIACRSTGFNHVDLIAAQERGIITVNVPTYGDATVAEYAFTLLLALTRKVQEVLRTETERFTTEQLRGHDLQGKTFGVIGTGHIGLKAIQIANGFSMKTIAYDNSPKDELQEKHQFTYVDLETLIKESDVISLHVPYNPSTHYIMNKERLGKMKPGAILVNTARGELVDTKALIEVLDSGLLGGAAIDVVEGEVLLNYNEETALLRSSTLSKDVLRHSIGISILEKMPNVIISPHNAFNTVEAVNRINQTTAENILNYLQGNITNRVAEITRTFGKLILARHTESIWNASGRWSGTADVYLSDKGFKEAAKFGQILQELNIRIDNAFCSEQVRTRETLHVMLNAAQQFGVHITSDGALNERDYGEYTGKNKWDVEELIGEEAFDALRRGWDVPVPGGETLKMVYDRVVPYYVETIFPLIQSGKNVLITAHGNSIRALMKYLNSVSDEDISEVEMLFGEIILCDISPDGLCESSSVARIETLPPPA
jgi:D-lactate dehydrogenase